MSFSSFSRPFVQRSVNKRCLQRKMRKWKEKVGWLQHYSKGACLFVKNEAKILTERRSSSSYKASSKTRRGCLGFYFTSSRMKMSSFPLNWMRNLFSKLRLKSNGWKIISFLSRQRRLAHTRPDINRKSWATERHTVVNTSNHREDDVRSVFS